MNQETKKVIQIDNKKNFIINIIVPFCKILFIFISLDRDIEFPKKKKHRLVLLSESSDDDDDDMDSKNENNSNTEIKIIPNNLSPLFNDSEAIVSTQQLMGFCSGQFQSQKLDTKVSYKLFILFISLTNYKLYLYLQEDNEEVDDFEDNFDSEV
jgi:hypothetical protein